VPCPAARVGGPVVDHERLTRRALLFGRKLLAAERIEPADDAEALPGGRRMLETASPGE